MTFYFVRHGETDWNVQKKIQGTTDVPLNEKGLQQAMELAKKLVSEEYKIDCVYTSPQIRAQATARMVAAIFGSLCKVLPDLSEMDFGKWEGDNWPNIEIVYGEIYYHWNSHRRYVHTPEGECYNDVLGRTFRALEHIMHHENGNVLVVSHSAIIMSLRCYLAGLCIDDESMLAFRTDNAEVVAVEAEEIKRAIERFAEEETLINNIKPE